MKTRLSTSLKLGFAAIAGGISLVGLPASEAHNWAIAETASTVASKPADAPPANNSAITSLAKHLKEVGARMYGAYWCPHCNHQKEMFGAAAFRQIDYVECDPRGKNPRPNLCKAANIKGYPTWEIQGKMYMGVQSLEELAKASGYKGSQRF